MNTNFRATMALALTLIGAGVVAAPPEDATSKDKAPTFPKRPGQEPPARAAVGGGGPTNHNENGPSCPGGPVYRKVTDPDSGVPGWRAFQFSLYYRETKDQDGNPLKDGPIHAYQPGQDRGRDLAFPKLASQKGLVLMGRQERRALHKLERKRYAAIVKARKNAPTQEGVTT